MSLPSFATQTVTVQRAGTTTDHGNTIPNWGAVTTHTETGVSVQPGGGNEDTLGRDAVTTLWTVYAPLEADILDTDRVVVFGVAYEVDGPVKRWETGVLDHKEISLKAVSG